LVSSHHSLLLLYSLFFFNVPPPPEISPLSLHDALPILEEHVVALHPPRPHDRVREGELERMAEVEVAGHVRRRVRDRERRAWIRSEEHTSELQSLTNLVCRLLLEKKKERTTSDDTGQTA